MLSAFFLAVSLILTPIQAQCVRDRVEIDLRLNPLYKWGGASLDPGTPKDCSGSLYAYFAA